MDYASAPILAMELNPGDIISWLITGALAGSLVGRLLRGRDGYGFMQNLLLGCGGALIGFLVFGLFSIEIPGLGDIKITANHLVGAVAGTVVLILILKFMGKGKKKKKAA